MSKELLFSVTKKDLDITWFSGTGKGGQHRNKHQNCCRIKHRDSGVIVTGQESRERKVNLRKAFIRLTEHPKFRIWLNNKVLELDGKISEEEFTIPEEDLLIEYL
jgi:protein subunit release factor A